MYKYEELELNEIINNADIDLDSGEAIYAIAQCFKTGKGVDVDIAKYKKLLQEAAELGLENAINEISTVKSNIDSELGSNEKQEGSLESEVIDTESLTKLSLTELIEKSETNPLAFFELSRRCKQLNDKDSYEKYYHYFLDACDKISDREAQAKAYCYAADCLRDDNLIERRRLLELARELGSIDATFELINIYKYGQGGSEEEEYANDCMNTILREGSARQKIEIVNSMLDCGKKIDSILILDEIIKSNQADELSEVLASLMLSAVNVTEYPISTDVLRKYYEITRKKEQYSYEWIGYFAKAIMANYYSLTNEQKIIIEDIKREIINTSSDNEGWLTYEMNWAKVENRIPFEEKAIFEDRFNYSAQQLEEYADFYRTEYSNDLNTIFEKANNGEKEYEYLFGMFLLSVDSLDEIFSISSSKNNDIHELIHNIFINKYNKLDLGYTYIDRAAQKGLIIANIVLGELFARGFNSIAAQYDRSQKYLSYAADKGYELPQITLTYVYWKQASIKVADEVSRNLIYKKGSIEAAFNNYIFKKEGKELYQLYFSKNWTYERGYLESFNKDLKICVINRMRDAVIVATCSLLDQIKSSKKEYHVDSYEYGRAYLEIISILDYYLENNSEDEEIISEKALVLYDWITTDECKLSQEEIINVIDRLFDMANRTDSWRVIFVAYVYCKTNPKGLKNNLNLQAEYYRRLIEILPEKYKSLLELPDDFILTYHVLYMQEYTFYRVFHQSIFDQLKEIEINSELLEKLLNSRPDIELDNKLVIAIGEIYEKEQTVEGYIKACEYYAKNNTEDANVKIGKCQLAIGDLLVSDGKPESYFDAMPYYESAEKIGIEGADKKVGYAAQRIAGLYMKTKEKENFARAYEYFMRGKQSYYYYSIAQVGNMKLAGIGTEKDIEGAIECYKYLIDNDWGEGYYRMGTLYDNGVGVKKDTDVALDYYIKANEKGYSLAWYAYYRTIFMTRKSTDGVKKEGYNKMVEQFKNGNEDACKVLRDAYKLHLTTLPGIKKAVLSMPVEGEVPGHIFGEQYKDSFDKIVDKILRK